MVKKIKLLNKISALYMIFLCPLLFWGCADNSIETQPVYDTPAPGNKAKGNQYSTVIQPEGAPFPLPLVLSLDDEDNSYNVKLFGILIEEGSYSESGSTLTLTPETCLELTGQPPAVPVDCTGPYENEKISGSITITQYRSFGDLTLVQSTTL